MTNLINELAKYNKLWIALLGAVLTVLVQTYGSNHDLQIVVSVLAALGVYAAPNGKV